ncbi:UNVERIFIED_CONTAM: hypothetical protein PYX00_002971 [Menopon gallinae]|uniref:F-box domain-containing protein n=1 Tax=Menopon gallinae TaxID=328185 RepID=A0AAW2I0C2_9NEOP
MEQFWFLFCAMGLSNTMFFDGFNPNFDVLGDLPYEIATSILRLLDGKTLLTAALVSRKWFRIIKSDKVLRGKIRDEFRARRMAGMFFRPGVHLSNLSQTFSNVSNRTENVGRVKELGAEPRIGKTQSKKRKFESSVSLKSKKTKTNHGDNAFNACNKTMKSFR